MSFCIRLYRDRGRGYECDTNIFLILQGFQKILLGEYDHLPEVAFYMVGPIEEVTAKAETLAKQAA